MQRKQLFIPVGLLTIILIGYGIGTVAAQATLKAKPVQPLPLDGSTKAGPADKAITVKQTAPNPLNQPQTITVVKNCGTIPPPASGLRYGPLPVGAAAPSVTESQAIAIAKSNATVAIPDSAQIVTNYVLFSDDDYYKTDDKENDPPAKRQYFYQNVPTWVVSFCGVNISTNGPAPTNGDSPAPTFARELNVYIDAQTGKLMESFTYR